MSAKLATYVECSTILGAEDVYKLLEVSAVNAHNERVYEEAMTRKQNV